MIEIIGLIASIIAIIGALITGFQFVFKPYIRKRNELKKICTIVDENFKRWKELEYSGRGGTMISHDDFIMINKYRSTFNNKDKELRSFLLRNAIQNGLGGEWGKWLNMNRDNEKIILPLIIILKGSSGLRPAWRTAVILEKIFSANIETLDTYIPEKEKDNTSLISIVNIIKNKGIADMLNNLSQNGLKEDRDKAKMVLEEFETFSKELNDFAKEQTIIMTNYDN